MLCFYWGEAQVQELHKDWDSLLSQMFLYLPSVLHIVYTNVLATVYKTAAEALTEYGEQEENPKDVPPDLAVQQLPCLDGSRCSTYLLSLALENHREESSFQNHLTAKVLVVRSSASHSFLLRRLHQSISFYRSAFFSSSVHVLQLLCGALPHRLLQAGRASASKGNS